METIFTDIVKIMQNDYAGCIDKQGWENPEIFLESIRDLKEKEQLTRTAFLEIVKDNLLDFKDLHIFFNDLDSQNINQMVRGFHMRRFVGFERNK